MSLRRGLLFGLLVGLVGAATAQSGRRGALPAPWRDAIAAARTEAAATRTRLRFRLQEARRRGTLPRDALPRDDR